MSTKKKEINNLSSLNQANDFSPEYIAQLVKAFDVFSKNAQEMEKMYGQLEKRVAYLTNELDKKNKELDRANRLAAIGELAAGVAHEIRNPLGGVELCATILKRELEASDGKKDLVTQIVEGVKKINNIVANLLTLSRDNAIVVKEFDLNILLEEVINGMNRFADQHQVLIENEADLKNIKIKGDISQIRRVFINLLSNAIEATKEKPNAVIRIETNLSDAEADRMVKIKFIDNGVGMDEESLDKIFNPFFTTKDTGTGLGLAISHKIIGAHQGKILVDSKKGEGTTFSVHLPLI